MASISAEMKKQLVREGIRGSGFEPKYNEMTLQTQNGSGQWENAYDSILHTNLADIASPRYIDDMVLVMGWENKFHPIKTWIDNQRMNHTWDGVDYIHRLAQYFENPDGMFEIYLRKWMIGAIDRIYNGGTRNPILVLDGEQESGKSSFVKWLCPKPFRDQYFMEGQVRPDDKDHRLALLRNFIWEIGEIDATTKRADASALKDFLTISKVKERGAYDKRLTEHPTVCSFIGTFNNVAGFLTDPTGSSRFRVCKITKINWLGYSTDPDDLSALSWAQAIALWDSGETNELSREDKVKMERINSQYTLDNNTRFALEEYFVITPGSDDFTSSNYIREVLQDHGLRGADIDSRRVAACLLEAGCRKAQKKTNGVNRKGWFGISKRLDAEIEHDKR